jgi:hypothetical protein
MDEAIFLPIILKGKVDFCDRKDENSQFAYQMGAFYLSVDRQTGLGEKKAIDKPGIIK